MALSCRPDLLIADEPTTALDVTIQAQILDLFDEIAADPRRAILFISHDFGVIARVCDDVAVMHQGKVVEAGPVQRVLTAPEHPYTRALLGAIPRAGQRGQRLTTVEDYEHVPAQLGLRGDGFERFVVNATVAVASTPHPCAKHCSGTRLHARGEGYCGPEHLRDAHSSPSPRPLPLWWERVLASWGAVASSSDDDQRPASRREIRTLCHRSGRGQGEGLPPRSRQFSLAEFFYSVRPAGAP